MLYLVSQAAPIHCKNDSDWNWVTVRLFMTL